MNSMAAIHIFNTENIHNTYTFIAYICMCAICIK